MLLIQRIILSISISIFLLIISSNANDTKQEVLPSITLTNNKSIIKNVSNLASMEINNSSNIEMATTTKSFELNENSKNCKTDQTSKFIDYEELQCKSSRGEYLNTIELADGTKHREEGIIINGKFSIRGYFHSKADQNNLHIYIQDEKGIHYFIAPIQGSGVQQYGIDDDDDAEICSVRGDSCIDPKIIASMLG